MEIRHHRMHHEVVQGYDMSSKQLDEMWRYENILAHYLLDLPLRQCSATPSDKWGKEMNSVEFLKLNGDVRKMWCRAGQMFVAFKCNGDAGWGLKVREDLGKKLMVVAGILTIQYPFQYPHEHPVHLLCRCIGPPKQ